MMATITRAIRAEYGMAADLIPAAILKSIDQAELYDRLAYSRDLTRKSQSAIDPIARRGYSQLAKAMISAQPRAVTQRQHTERITRAAGLPPGSRQADAIRKEAAGILDTNPIAPRRAEHASITKAQAVNGGGMQVIYDPAGQIIGLCDPAAITPVQVMTAQQFSDEIDAASTSQPTEVAKRTGKDRPARRPPGRR